MVVEASHLRKEEKTLGTELTEPSVVIVDSLRLRRSCVARILEQWSASEGLTVASVAPVGLPTECETKANCRLVVFSIGGQTLANSDMLQTIEALNAIFPDAPLVVMSDKDEPSEIMTAFQVGAVGFIPASLDPQIALRAFTFIVGGGSYFPPSVLTSSDNFSPVQQADPASKQTQGGGGIVSNFGGKASDVRHLTARQTDVVKLLRNGMPNKVIARHLGMTEATVKVHVRQIMRKLGATNRTQVAICLSAHSIRNIPERHESLHDVKRAVAN